MNDHIKSARQKKRDEYFSVRELKERGWTERLVRLYLGEPDWTVPNPRRRSAAPKRLYLITRVAGIESVEQEFQEDKQRSARYSVRLKVQSDNKRLQLEGLVRGIPMPPLEIPWSDVRKLAVDRRASQLSAVDHSVERVAVDILLDTMKSLDWHLDEFMWHSGIREARKLLRRRMLAHVINHYPMLAEAAKDRAAQETGNTDEW